MHSGVKRGLSITDWVLHKDSGMKTAGLKLFEFIETLKFSDQTEKCQNVMSGFK